MCSWPNVKIVPAYRFGSTTNSRGLERVPPPPPNDDLPDDVRELYDEARNIVEDSSRGATALLRLSIQILCKHLGQPGKNVNKDIATLVTDGLEPTVQKALDAVRVVGNSAVHPGQIDMRDNTEVATSLFALINVIADRMITQPKRVEEVYQALPKDALDAIERRDKNSHVPHSD